MKRLGAVSLITLVPTIQASIIILSDDRENHSTR